MIIDIPKEILQSNLTLGAKLVYGAAKADPELENYQLALRLGISDKQLNRYILELSKAGVITRTRGQIQVVDEETRQEEYRKLRELQSQVKIFTDGRFLGKE